MRRLFIVFVVSFVVASTGAAQSRWTFSAGPEWTPFANGRFYGGRVRVEYDMINPTSPLRLRLETGGFWSPTQSYNGSFVIAGGTFGGERQVFDLTFGLSAAITPLPKARFSPYVVMAAVARQSWTRGSGWVQYPGSAPQYFPQATNSVGDLLLQPGIGIRARVARRVFQLEWRHFEHISTLTLGTHLPF
jgi:hypothetical protein